MLDHKRLKRSAAPFLVNDLTRFEIFSDFCLQEMLEEKLNISEEWWPKQYVWLEAAGYRLRPRYKPDWVPSWVQDPKLSYWSCEDRLGRIGSVIMDAIGIKDNRPKILKRIYRRSINSDEKRIASYLSSPELMKDPSNHCVPIENVLSIPGDDTYELLVMPLLITFDKPRFDTVGECVDFFKEIFVGIQFLHRRRIVHRDCTGRNLMMDGSEIYPEGFHPVNPIYNVQGNGYAHARYTRTQRPPKYLWIDFGMSHWFDECATSFLLSADPGNDITLPEYQVPNLLANLDNIKHDPFPSDIYYLGNLIKRYFFEGHHYHSIKLGLDFMLPLVKDMTQPNPSKRPTIDECISRLDEIIKSLSSSKLRSQIHHAKDNVYGDIARFFPYWRRRISYVVRRIPPIPVRMNNLDSK